MNLVYKGKFSFREKDSNSKWQRKLLKIANHKKNYGPKLGKISGSGNKLKVRNNKLSVSTKKDKKS